MANTDTYVNTAATYQGYTGQDPRTLAALAGYLNGLTIKTN